MITSIRIRNYRSFVDAEVKLQPFSLVVGANGSGKSNLLKFFGDAAAFVESVEHSTYKPPFYWDMHQMHLGAQFGFVFEFTNIEKVDWLMNSPSSGESIEGGFPWKRADIPHFNIDPTKVSNIEAAVPDAYVAMDGSGTAQVLDILKNGDRDDLFEKIESSFRQYVPEVQKLSLRTVEKGKKQIQVREKGLNVSVPATELSEGTRLILAILTIVHQENPPPVILLEDIDRGLHPRLFEYVAPLLKNIAETNQINIVATTHNPYLVDCFQDNKEAVIIVEKKDGESKLSTLASRLEGLDYDKVDPEDMPLGDLWFSGLVGGVPAKLTRRP